MKKFCQVFLAAGTLFLVSCSGGGGLSAKAKKNKEVNSAIMKAYESGDFSKMSEYMAADAIDHGGEMGDVKGVENIVAEMKKYLENVKAQGAWNEKAVLSTIQAIMNHHIGAPPKHILVDGKKITPKQYFQSLELRLDDYVDLLSLSKDPYYQMVEYTVPDNWWHSKKYLNVPLEDFMDVMRNAVRQGFSVCLGGDVSEPGYDLHAKVAVVPSFDIPSQYIDENARMFRFANETTTDDHGVHCVGWMEKDGKDWYLIKDSGSGSRNTNPIGYYFYHEDYIKLKMMNIMVHKDAAQAILQKYTASIQK